MLQRHRIGLRPADKSDARRVQGRLERERLPFRINELMIGIDENRVEKTVSPVRDDLVDTCSRDHRQSQHATPLSMLAPGLFGPEAGAALFSISRASLGAIDIPQGWAFDERRRLRGRFGTHDAPRGTRPIIRSLHFFAQANALQTVWDGDMRARVG
ncbi:hypothetical protein [Phreatobacter stygius]|uniref:Uncharacterized protein n=1 Tax=Phreatobacter stygius TaxID=1940610 RepID=A0A4D7B788_9HYPH|nr:hypothetical protein [Phreatobacter stygius]QCI66228.1 hypothetical protein E8M01_19625 [Phreatobacter stygius]